MSIMKNLEPEDILISTFQVHKTFTFTNTDSGSGVYGIPLVKGSDSNLYGYSLSTAASSSFGSGSSDSPKTRTFYHVPLYHTINKLYYKDINNMKGYIDYVRGVPANSNGASKYKSTRELYNTSASLVRPHTRRLHDTGTLITVPQKFYGEYINPFSVRLTDDSTDSTFILQDDGYGNLYDTAFSGSYASRTPNVNNSGSIVGNVFYNDGIIVVTDTGSYATVGTGTGTDGFSLKFDSSLTIYEREYVCKIEESEFRYTTNRSLKVDQSGSINFSTSQLKGHFQDTKYDDWPYHKTGYATGSYKNDEYKIGTELIGAASHSDFATYVTGIGLYDDFNQLLAVGKVAKPIKNEKELALTFVVRFDTN